MSPYEAGNGDDYIQIGIARQTDDNLGIQKQYEKSGKNIPWAPTSRTSDSSVPADGRCDAYKEDCDPSKPIIPPITGKRTLGEIVKDAEDKWSSLSKELFIAYEVARTDKWKDHPDYETVKKEYATMAESAWNIVKRDKEIEEEKAKEKEKEEKEKKAKEEAEMRKFIKA